MIAAAQRNLASQSGIASCAFINEAWGDVNIEGKYEIILASHIHIDRKLYREWLVKMHSHLSDNGMILFVNNTKDAGYKCKQHFRPMLVTEEELRMYPPFLHDDIKEYVEEVLGDEVKIQEKFYPVRTRFLRPELDLNGSIEIPVETQAVLRFAIGKPWDAVPVDIRRQIVEYLNREHLIVENGTKVWEILGQEGILIVRKK